MTRFSRNKVIAFDFDEALAFEGDTGPYLQYAAVRAANIFRKLEEQGLPGRLEAGGGRRGRDARPRAPRRRPLGRREDLRADARDVREGRRDAGGLAPRPARARGGRGVPPPLPHAPDPPGARRGEPAGTAGGAAARVATTSTTSSASSAFRSRSGCRSGDHGSRRRADRRSGDRRRCRESHRLVENVFREEFDVPSGTFRRRTRRRRDGSSTNRGTFS